MLPKPEPVRSEIYLDFLRKRPRCLINLLICRQYRIEAAHTGSHGRGSKAHDIWALPLCAWHHRLGPDSYHALGGEELFEQKHNVDLKLEALRLVALFITESQNQNGVVRF